MAQGEQGKVVDRDPTAHLRIPQDESKIRLVMKAGSVEADRGN